MAEYISRPNLMEALTNSDAQRRIRAMSGAEAYDEFLTLLNAAPAADVAPVRRGLWVYGADEHGCYALCSICKDSFYVQMAVREHTNYCPNCGAKMDGGDGV